jgi:hypothetical protein
LVGTAAASGRFPPADPALLLDLPASPGSKISKTEVELRKSG